MLLKTFIVLLGKYRSQSPPILAVKSRTQQTQTLKNSNYERENLISGHSHTELPPGISDAFHFIPYVRTNEVYYLDPEAPLSRPVTQDTQYQNAHGKWMYPHPELKIQISIWVILISFTPGGVGFSLFWSEL